MPPLLIAAAAWPLIALPAPLASLPICRDVNGRLVRCVPAKVRRTLAAQAWERRHLVRCQDANGRWIVCRR